MAEKILPTRILLRCDTYANWMASQTILKQGEAAIAYFPLTRRLEDLSNTTPDNTPPAVGIKIGDGSRTFSQLPWVQAIAADVYNWAKAENKPTYTAQEIQGLQSFIEQVGGGASGGGGSSTRIYQIVEGTDENIHKFYLRYIDDNGNWVIDTSSYIDLTALSDVVSWIGTTILNEYPSMTARVSEQIQFFLGRLEITDIAQANQFVTSVSQEGGIVSVTRARPNFSNLTGYATVSQGGTGRTSLPEGEVLVGNENNAITTRKIADEITNNNDLVPNYLIKQYVDSATAGLEGAMHYVGDATVAPQGANNPQISGYNFSNAQPGDVVLWEYKEYVWTGGSWRLLGDEGSYAVKGSIKNADIDDEANIAQSKIAGLADSLDTKVDKENGKGLSTNDYTTEEKVKLAGIEDGAQKNAIEHIFLNEDEQIPHTANGQNNVVELQVKEFDDESRRKLGTIAEGAQVNTIEGISVNGTAQSVNSSKVVALQIKEFTDEDRRKFNTIEENAQENVIEEIALNGTTVQPDQNKKVNLEIISLTQEQVDKLDGIEAGAEVNVINSIIYDRVPLNANNGVVTITPDPHTEHENVIESIVINGTEYPPDSNKQVNITIDQAALNLNVLEGAEIPPLSGNTKVEVDIVSKKLQLARIAATGNVSDLLQTADTYVLLDCGSSTDVI